MHDIQACSKPLHCSKYISASTHLHPIPAPLSATSSPFTSPPLHTTYPRLEGSDQPGIIQGDPDKGPLDFDFDSIMIYPSDAQTDTAACRNDIAHCPIVRRAGQDQNGNAKFEYMPAKYKPSVEDAKFIRKHYPWVET